MSEILKNITHGDETIPGAMDEQEEEQVNESFVVDTDDKAEWCLGKIKEHQAEIDKWTSHYDAEKRRTCMKHENAIIYLTSRLQNFFLGRSVAGLTSRTKTEESYKLPSGKIFMKDRDPEFDKDEAVMIEWLRQNAPQFIKVKESVDWAGVKEAFWAGGTELVKVDDETGEIIKIPGVTVTPREPEFKVKEK